MDPVRSRGRLDGTSPTSPTYINNTTLAQERSSFPRPTSNGMEERAETGVGFSHMATLAAFSAIALLGVSGWQIYQVFVRGKPANAINVVDSSTQARASTPYGSVN